ncbi:MAG: hypothetical protein IPM63_17945 [Acidobacteriota bacterium]|nr:MAG: hypothetical protein IPM63_17945 [Acidobacteriota bacterium]
MKKKPQSCVSAFRIVFAVAILALFVQQDVSAQHLVDEFGDLQCGDLIVRIEIYVRELAKDKEAPGFVQTFASKEDFLYSLHIESVILGVIESLESDSDIHVDPEQIEFSFGGYEESGRTRLWIMPKGTESTADDRKPLSLKLAEGTKPFKFRSTKRIPGGWGCIYGGIDQQFTKLLKANPQAKGNLVIADKNQEAFQKKKIDMLSALSEIDPKRLRFFFVKSERSYVEYWIVPKKAKK